MKNNILIIISLIIPLISIVGGINKWIKGIWK